MRIACLSFTDKGKILGDMIAHSSGEMISSVYHYTNSEIEGGIKDLMEYLVRKYDGLIFISATGIAVRMMNPYIKDKTIDPAVVVVDDLGRFSISLLSGHIGGGNELAKWVAHIVGAIPVITTASDNRGIESLDVFATRNNYYMEDMESVKKITSMMVNGKKIGFYSEMEDRIDYDNLVILDDLKNIGSDIEGLIIVSSQSYMKNKFIIPYATLIPKNINIGIGCKKGMESSRIIKAIEEAFHKVNLSIKGIKAIGTVEIKKHEKGIIEASKYFNCPLKILTIEEIKKVEQRFEKSQFVKDTIGVYSVSEPCAYLLGGKIISRKTKYGGITISIAKEENNG